MPIKNLRLCGRSSQVVTTGANLLPCAEEETVTTLKEYNFTNPLPADTYRVSIISANREPINGAYQIGAKYNDDTSVFSNINPKTKYGLLKAEKPIVSFSIYADAAYNESQGKTTIFTGLMVIAGSNAIPYEPYTGGAPSPSPPYPQKITDAGNDGNIAVKIQGKNLIDIASGIKQGYNVTQPNLKLIPGQAYTFTNVNATTGVSLYEATTNTNLTKSHPAAGLSKAFVMPNIPNAVAVLAGLNGDWNTGDLSKIKIQLELGDKSTPYEPYKTAQTLTIPTPGGLSGIPVSSGGNYTDENGQQWVTDEVDLAKGVYIKRIEKIASYNNESINGSYISETGELTVGARVLFVLDTSVETPLLPETIAAFRKLCMNYPVTTITNSDNCGMEVAYNADTKAYIDGKIAEISAAIVSK